MNNTQIADALESLLWPNMSIGNKGIIKAAVEALRRPVDMKDIPRYEPEGYHIDEAYMVADPEGESLDRDEVINYLRSIGLEVIANDTN